MLERGQSLTERPRSEWGTPPQCAAELLKIADDDGIATMITKYSSECACETCLQKDLCAKDGKCQKDLKAMDTKATALGDACKGAAAEATAAQTVSGVKDVKKTVDDSCAKDSSAGAMKRFAAAASAFAAAGLALVL